MSFAYLDSLTPDELFDYTRFLSYKEIAALCENYPRFGQFMCSPDTFNALNVWKRLYNRDISTYDLPPGSNYRQAYESILTVIRNNHKHVHSLYYAAARGYNQLIETILADQHFNHDEYDTAMEEAAESGYIDIVVRMMQEGANDYNNAIRIAEAEGHDDIAAFIRQWPKTKERLP